MMAFGSVSVSSGVDNNAAAASRSIMLSVGSFLGAGGGGAGSGSATTSSSSSGSGSGAGLVYSRGDTA